MRVVVEPLGRNTAAAIALAALDDRAASQDEVMVVLPADQTVAGRRRLPGRAPVGRRASRDGGLRDRGSARHPRDPGRPPGDRVWLPHPGSRQRRGRRRPAGLSADPLRGEAQAGPGRGAVQGRQGRRLERRDLPVAPPGDPRGARPATRASSSRSGRWRARRPASNGPTRRSRSPVSIDYAVMEGAAQNGQVVMASMDVGWSDLGSWSALLKGARRARHGRRRPGGRDRRGRARRPHRPADRRPAGGRRAPPIGVA